MLHNASTSLTELHLLNIKIEPSSVAGTILPSLETLKIDNCGGAAGSAVAALTTANSSLVNLFFFQSARPFDIVEYDGTATGQMGVLGLSGLPPAQLQTLYIADNAGVYGAADAPLVELVRLLHTRGVFDELTSLRFANGNVRVSAADLASQAVTRPLPKLKRLQLPLCPGNKTGHIEGFAKISIENIMVIDFLAGNEYSFLPRTVTEVCDSHIADLKPAMDANDCIPDGVQVRRVTLSRGNSWLEGDWGDDEA